MKGDLPWVKRQVWPGYEQYHNDYLLKDGLRILKYVILKRPYALYGIISIIFDLSSNYIILPTENKNGHPGASHGNGVGFDIAYPTIDNAGQILNWDALAEFVKMFLNCFPRAEIIVGPEEYAFLRRALGSRLAERINVQNDNHAFAPNSIWSHIHCWLHRGGFQVDWDYVRGLQK